MPPKPRLFLYLAAAALLAAAPAHALRVVQWNPLNYPGSTASVREPAYRTVLGSLSPDIVVCQEMGSQAGVNQFLANVLNTLQPGEWAAAPFRDGPDTDNALFYRTAVVSFVDTTVIPTDLRDITEYRMRLAGYASAAGEIRLFSMHLKASSGSTYEQQRLIEATAVRNYASTLPAGTNFVYCGDFNTYSSTDLGYQKLIASEADNDGRAKDPLNRPGSWNNNGTFADVHTQSTRTGYLTPSDGGATGGLDDRFDFQLISYALDDGVGMDWVPGSYLAYGNDGAHFNLDINAGTNGVVSQAIADALQRASDHLPIKVDYRAPALASVWPARDFGRVLVGAAAAETVYVADVAPLPGAALHYTAAAGAGFSSAAGPFQLAAGDAPAAHLVSLATATPGVAAGTLAISSDDPESPVRSVALAAHLLAHAVPSLAPDAAAGASVVDWGTQAAGGFAEQTVPVFNFDYGADQALLEPYAVTITGGDGHFTVAAAAGNPDQVGADSVVYRVAFHDSSTTPDSLYEALLTIDSRDESGLAGAIALDPLSVTLRATVAVSAVAVEAALPRVTELHQPWPNPSAAGLRLRFDLARPAGVRLDLYDVQGRRVAALARGGWSAGRHEVRWSAPAIAAGVYFVRFAADGVERTARVVLLK